MRKLCAKTTGHKRAGTQQVAESGVTQAVGAPRELNRVRIYLTTPRGGVKVAKMDRPCLLPWERSTRLLSLLDIAISDLAVGPFVGSR
jgi:hypothetical protein